MTATRVRASCTGGFYAVPFVLDATCDCDGRPIRLQLEDPAATTEPMTPDKRTLLTRRGDPDAFLPVIRRRAWRLPSRASSRSR
jgi:hypothetical protein